MNFPRIATALLLCIALVPLTGFRKAVYKKGDEIMAELKARQAASTEVDLVKMVIIDENDNIDVRELVSAVKPDADGNLRYLIRFLSPADINGVSLLTLDQPDAEPEQYFYLPALGQPRKITGSQKDTPFMGSDFTFEDLRKENPDKFQYYRLLDGNLEGQDVYVIMSAPANVDIKERQDYDSRLLYIDKETYNILKIEFYVEGDKTPLKTFSGQDYGSPEINGSSERPRRATMQNHSSKTTTVMTILKARLNEPLPEDIFTIDALTNPTASNEQLLKILDSPSDENEQS